MPEFRTNKNGKVYPLTPKKGGGVAVAVVLGLAIAGAVTVDANGGFAGAAPGSCQASSGDAKSEAEAGHRTTAWQQLCWRELHAKPESSRSCVASSYGQVRGFFAGHPCTGLQRLTAAVSNGKGGTVAVSVSWIGTSDSDTAQQLKALVTRNGTGSITPKNAAAVGHPEATFDGTYFAAAVDGAQVTVAEAAAVGGHPGADTLRVAKEVAVLLPRP
ncbi:hypothetical protein [Amycolatopsis sp. NPDC004378]